MFYKYAKSAVPSQFLDAKNYTPSESVFPLKEAVRHKIDTNHNFYIDAWAVSSYEKYGLNENADGFEHDELSKSYGTFVGAMQCLDHNNWDESLAIGRIIDAIYSPKDQWVRIASGIERVKAEKRYPGLEQKIEAKLITDTSMGCFCRESVCTIPKCANVATDPAHFCDHVTRMRGQVLANSLTNWEPIKCGELNRGVVFFEDSIITNDEGADCNAKIIAKLASKQTSPNSIPMDVFIMEIRKLANRASENELTLLTNLVENIERLI